MRLLSVIAALSCVASVACCGTDEAESQRFYAGLEALREEAVRHHDEARRAGSMEELHGDLDHHEVAMGEAMERMQHAMADMHCTHGMDGMDELVSGMEAMMLAHRHELEAASTLEEAMAACTLHRDRTLERADRIEAHAGEMSCDMGGMDHLR